MPNLFIEHNLFVAFGALFCFTFCFVLPIDLQKQNTFCRHVQPWSKRNCWRSWLRLLVHPKLDRSTGYVYYNQILKSELDLLICSCEPLIGNDDDAFTEISSIHIILYNDALINPNTFITFVNHII